jgi:hypothetical protein
MCIMAEILLPPRISAYFKMVSTHWVKHTDPGLFAFWYQQEDRYRHEQIPDIKRLQMREYNEAITEYRTSGWWTPVKEHGSTFDPDSPWDHVMLLAVRSSDARRWWTESFKDDATKVILKIKNITTLVEGDAPIASSIAEHISTPYVPPLPNKAPKVKPEAPWKTPKAPHTPAGRPQHVSAPTRRGKDITNKFNICHGISNGKCTEVKSGPCGPNSCSKKPQFIHACLLLWRGWTQWQVL